ncbi:MAG: VWA domain-containing protein [Verrucomicrobiales bacterium]|nr:VWA domain-containing protein [Verrucomicrobiales bacterium]
MNGLVFAQPDWFWGGLVLLPLLVLRIWSHLGVSRRLPGLVSPRLSHRLINGATQARRWTVFTLQSLALLCLLTALARPQLGFEETENEVEARNLILAIDTSRSMLSDDLAPNRLDRAKLAAQDIILSLPDDRIGLIAFAGKPFLQAPLTVDHEAVLEAIEQLDTEVIPRGGTNLSAAVNLALETVKEAKLGPSALVLFSDGEALEGLAEIERVRDEASAAGLTVLTVGVGTTDGSIIPDVDENGQPIPGEFVKDENGQVVRTRLTPEPLQALASKGGAYVHLGGAASLTQVVEQIRSGLASSREEAGTTEKPIERFLWPLSAAFILLVLSHLAPLFWLKPSPAKRRSLMKQGKGAVAAVAVATLLPIAGPAFAESGTPADRADAVAVLERALAEERSPEDRAFLQLRIGAEAYQSGNYEKAVDAFGGAAAEGSPRYEGIAFYNLGNTLYRRGETALSASSRAPSNPDQVQSLSAPGDAMTTAIREWEGAVEHYETALGLDPDNTRTAHNLEYVKKRLEELKKQQQEQQEQQQQKQDQQKDQDKKDDEQQKKEDESKKDESQQNQDQNQQGNQEPQDQDSSSGDSKPEDQKGEDPGQSKPEDPSQPKDPSDSPEDSGQSDSEGKDQPPGEQQQPDAGQNPPEEPETPQDGKLEANPNQAQPGQANGNPAQGQPLQRNPETGYAPTEARQLLDALADETEVKPILPKARGERFKNW